MRRGTKIDIETAVRSTLSRKGQVGDSAIGMLGEGVSHAEECTASRSDRGQECTLSALTLFGMAVDTPPLNDGWGVGEGIVEMEIAKGN